MTKALEVHLLLTGQYGEPRWCSRADPLSELIGTILSQNTSDVNSGRAFAALQAAFPTWQQVLDAPAQVVIEAIRSGGLAAIKGPRIQKVLATIAEERGELNLGFLDALPVDQARQWLLSLEGVGAKTAACVLLFSLGKPVIPVDTHVHRLARRLGLVEARATPEETEGILESLVLPEARYAFHMNLIAHGRRVCKAQSPRCEECVLACACAFAAGRSTNAVAP